MGNEFENLKRVGDILALHGREMTFVLIFLIGGLYLSKYFTKYVRIGLRRVTTNPTIISIISNSFHLLFSLTVVMVTATQAGFNASLMFRLLTMVGLVVIGVTILFRPYIPSLPFKVGNTIKSGNMFGIVEATTFLRTRIKTFDGLTVFIPNRQILNDIVINYHYTGTRRVKVDVAIGYDQDILKAKRIIEEIMIADPRVKKTPRPVVYTLDLDESWVKLGGRAWVDNKKYWVTRCEFIEKVKYRFGQEGIKIAFPQLGVHHYEMQESIEVAEEEIPA